MANAAAKKAIAKKKGASSFYLPILTSLNVIHCIITYFRGFSMYRICVTLIQWCITYVSYKGIIHDSEYSSSAVKHGSVKGQLSGGLYLDILGVVLLSQVGSWLTKGRTIIFMDSLMVIVPSIYGLYTWIQKKVNSKGSEVERSSMDSEAMKELEERRRKRAERRRQKRL